MATLAPAGRITVEVVEEELERLRSSWRTEDSDPGSSLLQAVLGEEAAAKLDFFDRVQLAEVVRLCSAPTLSEAGRRLFAVSRQGKKSSNDADRLRKYLGRFNLNWAKVREATDT